MLRLTSCFTLSVPLDAEHFLIFTPLVCPQARLGDRDSVFRGWSGLYYHLSLATTCHGPGGMASSLLDDGDLTRGSLGPVECSLATAASARHRTRAGWRCHAERNWTGQGDAQQRGRPRLGGNGVDPRLGDADRPVLVGNYLNVARISELYA